MHRMRWLYLFGGDGDSSPGALTCEVGPGREGGIVTDLRIQ